MFLGFRQERQNFDTSPFVPSEDKTSVVQTKTEKEEAPGQEELNSKPHRIQLHAGEASKNKFWQVVD